MFVFAPSSLRAAGAHTPLLAEHGEDPRQLAAVFAALRRAVQRAGAELHPILEQGGGHLLGAPLEILNRQLLELLGSGHDRLSRSRPEALERLLLPMHD